MLKELALKRLDASLNEMPLEEEAEEDDEEDLCSLDERS